jgi:hypothetical protein
MMARSSSRCRTLAVEGGYVEKLVENLVEKAFDSAWLRSQATL